MKEHKEHPYAEIRAFFTHTRPIVELSDSEIDQVINCAREAIGKGEDWGIKGVIKFDKYPPKGGRRYVLGSVNLCKAEVADYTVTKMLEYIEHLAKS